MDISNAIEEFLDHRRHRSRGTRRQYRYWLHDWEKWRKQRRRPAGLAEVRIEDFRDYLRHLEVERVAHATNPCRPAATSTGLKPASVAAARRTLRAFWTYLDGEELLSASQARFFRNNRIPAPPVIEEPRPFCDEETFARLIAACDGHDEEAARNRAILHLLYESGMRIGELCSLEEERVDLRARQAMVRGKGDRWRAVFWLPPGGSALISYVLQRPGPRGHGPLFRRVESNEPLSPDALRNIIKAIAEAAGVKLPHGAPVHWFRHAFAKRALENGLSDIQVAQLLGHTTVQMTMRYAREYPARLRQIYNRGFGLDTGQGMSYSRRQKLP